VDDDDPFGGPIEIPIEASLDLHLFRPSEVGDVVDAYLEAAFEKGLRELRIVHGRGRGVQRNRVRVHLERSSYVERFQDAPGESGGWGATLVWLRAR
jgi:DNA-nicking Smr family endonuclease